MPAPAYAPRHQKTFVWTEIDNFFHNIKSALPAFAPTMAASQLQGEEKMRTIVATDGSRQVLYGAVAMIKLTDNTGYICFYRIRHDLLKRHVQVEVSKEDENCLQVVSIKPASAKEFLGDFVALHECVLERSLDAHMLETLVAKTFGLFNFDMDKNVTIDVEDNDLDRVAILRDEAGLIVTDRMKFVSMQVNLAALQAWVDGTPIVSAERVRKTDFGDKSLVDCLAVYDKCVVGYERLDYVRFLCQKLKIESYTFAEEDGTVVGYVLFSKGRIFHLYAEKEDVAKALLSFACHDLTKDGDDKVLLCSCLNTGIHCWLESGGLKGHFSVLSTYRRLHTRCPPHPIAWNQVYVANIGWQLI